MGDAPWVERDDSGAAPSESAHARSVVCSRQSLHRRAVSRSFSAKRRREPVRPRGDVRHKPSPIRQKASRGPHGSMRRSQPSGVRMQTTVFYATNRAHEGPERFHPLRYGTRFSADGMENLRFGRVTLTADDARVSELLLRQKAFTGPGDGEALQDYFAQCARESQVI